MEEHSNVTKDIDDKDAGELDEALNELGMLSTAARPDFLREKLSRRQRRPLRRENEREISWCSSSSSSTSSSGSRRSSSSSSSSGSFSSLSYFRSHSRSSLNSYSIPETPTGTGGSFVPGSSTGSSSGYQSTGSFSSSSSLCSSLDLDQNMGIMASSSFKTVDFPKVVRRCHLQNYKPYIKPRRYSLQLGTHREEPQSAHDLHLNMSRGLNLSDSDASSGAGSGTGTPPPPNISSSACGQLSEHFKQAVLQRPFQLSFKEVRSNPTSPQRSFVGLAPGCGPGLGLGVAGQGHAHSAYLPVSDEAQQQSSFEGGGGALNAEQHFLTRSKSLDDLTIFLNLNQEDPNIRHSLKLFANQAVLRRLDGSIPGTASASSCDMFENVLQRISRLEM